MWVVWGAAVCVWGGAPEACGWCGVLRRRVGGVVEAGRAVWGCEVHRRRVGWNWSGLALCGFGLALQWSGLGDWAHLAPALSILRLSVVRSAVVRSGSRRSGLGDWTHLALGGPGADGPP